MQLVFKNDILLCFAVSDKLACCTHFCSELFCYQGGMYVFQMFDYQAGGISLVLIALLEVVGIGWFYGE